MDRKPTLDVSSFTAPRNQYFLMAPEDIIVDQSANGRWQPHKQEDILARMKSFEKEGQITPVIIRKVGGNKVQLVAGYCRHAAALLYNQTHDGKMPLKCILQEMSDLEALRKNKAENDSRVDLSHMDKAHLHRRFREDFGWSKEQVCEEFGCSEAAYYKLKKLLCLPHQVQMKVHLREIGLDDACALADLTPEEQKEVLKDDNPTEAASPEEEKPGAEAGVSSPAGAQTPQGAEDPFEDAPAPGPHDEKEAPPPAQAAAPAPEPEKPAEKPAEKPVSKTGKKTLATKIRQKKRERNNARVPRSLKEMSDFFQSLIGPAEPLVVQRLGALLLNYANGHMTDKQMAEALGKLLLGEGAKSA